MWSSVMGRRRLAASLHWAVRSYVHHFPSASLPKRGPSASWPGHDAGGATTFSSLLPEKFGYFSSGKSLSTMSASVDVFDSRRVGGSHSSMLSTSDRKKACCYEQRCGHTSGQNFEGKEKISVTFVSKDGEEKKIEVPVGMSMLEAAHENDIELEGACEGSLACSTCHVIVMEDDMYAQLPEPTDEENDMLDLAFGLTETSRLGCQVIAAPELDGLHLALPAATRNFAVDGHVPKPH